MVPAVSSHWKDGGRQDNMAFLCSGDISPYLSLFTGMTTAKQGRGKLQWKNFGSIISGIQSFQKSLRNFLQSCQRAWDVLASNASLWVVQGST